MISLYQSQIFILSFSILLLTVFFSKKRVEAPETTIYSCAILDNFVVVIFHTLSIFTISNVDKMPLINFFITRIYFGCVIFWLATLSYYIFAVSLKDEEKVKGLNSKKLQKLFKLAVCFAIILTTLTSILPAEYVSTLSAAYIYGTGPKLFFIVALILSISWIIRIIWRYKSLKKNKCLPVILYVVFILIAVIVQSRYPEVSLMSFVVTLVTFIMYFTIENPDLKIQKELLDLKLEAELANDIKDQFLKKLGHELNTPLGQAKSFNELCIDTAKEINNADLIEYTNYIDIALNNINDMFVNMLNVIKLESNKLTLEIKVYKTKDLAERIKEVASFELREKPYVKFECLIAENVPSVMTGDLVNIVQIVRCLISNAAKYTEKGSVKVMVSAIVHGNECELQLSVIDTGFGIKKEEQKNLFKKMERIDFEKNQSLRGMGLGLYFAQRLAEEMSGKIEVISELGKGSTFTIILNQKVMKESI